MGIDLIRPIRATVAAVTDTDHDAAQGSVCRIGPRNGEGKPAAVNLRSHLSAFPPAVPTPAEATSPTCQARLYPF